MDSKIEKEDIQALKPFGMECIWRKGFICGTFRNKKEFDDWDGEKYCQRNCIGQHGGRFGGGKVSRATNDGLAHKRAYTGNSPYRIALINSINRGLLSMRKLTAYDEWVESERAKGRAYLGRK